MEVLRLIGFLYSKLRLFNSAVKSLLLQGASAPAEPRLPPAAAQLTKVLAGLRHTFVVADATLPDMPLVFASEG
jgi:hypothetical protein